MTKRLPGLAAAVLGAAGLLTATAPPASAVEDGTLRFELSTTGTCSGLTFSGESAMPESDGGFALRLWDADADGVYTASARVDANDRGQDVRIRVYASPLALSPGDFLPVFQRDTPELTPAQEQVDAAPVTLIRDFGNLPTSGDRTLRASYRCPSAPPRGGVDAGGGGLARAGDEEVTLPGFALPGAVAGLVLLSAGVAALTRRPGGRRR